MSRDHLELWRRVHRTRDSDSDAIQLLDVSLKGTKYRPVRWKMGTEYTPDPLRGAPTAPQRPVQLAPGDHDVLLAGTVWLRIAGVPIDGGRTTEGEGNSELPAPTRREREVLVQLCGPRLEHGPGAVPPSNAQIGNALHPSVTARYVGEVMGRLYGKYDLCGTKEQNRLDLVDLAVRYGLVARPDLH